MNPEVIIYIEPGNRMHMMATRWNGEMIGKWFFRPYDANLFQHNCHGWQQWPKLTGYDLTLAEQQERRDRTCNGCRYQIVSLCRMMNWGLDYYRGGTGDYVFRTPEKCIHGKYLPR